MIETTQKLLNKVPLVTIYFWIIKILCTTVGETGADYLNETFNLGLSNTTFMMAALLLVALFFQFAARKYIPSVYWLAVILISILGTLITDNLTDNMKIPLEHTVIIFSLLLSVTFAIWYTIEKTLSFHAITTTRREIFYWLAILFTFALGTALGDLASEKFELGYFTSIFLFAIFILIVTIAHYIAKLNAILTFWLVYVITRPLGASIGDYLSQASTHGGLGFGTTMTSILFLIALLALVIYMTTTKKDGTPHEMA